MLKNWLFQNKEFCLDKKQGRLRLALFCFMFSFNFYSQVNFVGNPSFENVTCTMPNFISKNLYWNSLDSASFVCGGLCYHSCYGNVPNSGGGLYQLPKTGSGFARITFYYPPGRTYPKNRLKSNLIGGKTYCVKMYLNLQNNSPNSLDAFGIYLSDNTVDTISKCNIPLTYLTPQIQNSTSNFITDTLGWVEVSGTFVSNGNEKYLVIGNFKTDAATTLSPTAFSPGNWSEYNVDDVSVIDFNLPAYAGPDKNIFLGDSAFIGRPPEIGLECTWTTGTTTVGGGGGIWVKPTSVGTYSYVVTQNICGNIKTDTVFVNMSSGIAENIAFANSIGIYPQPAKDLLKININYFYENTVKIKITDVTGKEIERKELEITQGKTSLSTSELSSGVYILQITNSKNQIAVKRLVIVK